MSSSADARNARVVSREPLDSKDAKWIRLVKLKYTHPSSTSSEPLTYEAAERATVPEPKLRPSSSSDETLPPPSADSVGIIAILDLPTSTSETTSTTSTAPSQPITSEDESKSDPHILLLAQYRPPLDRVTIEIPAGLIDEGESAEEAAIRELREETGFVGTVIAPGETDRAGPRQAQNDSSGSRPQIGNQGITHFNDPGFTNTATHLIHINIDLNDPRNQPVGGNNNTKTTEARQATGLPHPILGPNQQLEQNEFVTTFCVPVRRLWAECRRLEEEGYAIDARVGTLAEGIEVARRLSFGLR